MFSEKRGAPRYTFTRPVNGVTLVLGQTLELPCRLIDVSIGGAKIELHTNQEQLGSVSLLGAKTISLFHQVHLGPWKIKLLIERIGIVEGGLHIGGHFLQTPILPISGLSGLLARHEAFYCHVEKDRFIVEGEFTIEAFRQVELSLTDGMAVLDLSKAHIPPETEPMLEKIKAAGISIVV